MGVEMITRHMRNEGAPEQNIAKMIDVFQSELTSHISKMWAVRLDTAEKVEASVKAMVAAIASLHGTGKEVLDQVIVGLQRMKAETPYRSKEHLVDSTGRRVLRMGTQGPKSMDSDDEDLEPDREARATEEATHTRSGLVSSQEVSTDDDRHKVRKNTSIYRETAAGPEHAHIEDGHPTITEPPKDDGTESSRAGKASKISTSWRWDIKDSASFQDVIENLKRMSDLFAYHALPVVRSRLGDQASRKQLRQEMERLLVDMSDAEFASWMESFAKLKDGDMSILTRPSSTFLSSKRVIHRTASTNDDGKNESTAVGNLGSSVGLRAPIKREAGVDNDVEEITPRFVQAGQRSASQASVFHVPGINTLTSGRASTSASAGPDQPAPSHATVSESSLSQGNS